MRTQGKPFLPRLERETDKYRESLFTSQKGKEPSLNMPEPLFFLIRPALSRNYFYQSLNLMGFYQSLTYKGEGKYVSPAPSTHPAPPKGG